MSSEYDHDVLASRALARLGMAAAELRAAAAELSRLAASAIGLLSPVLNLDTPQTWSSPWQRRATARLDGWARALRGSADAMVLRSHWYVRTAEAFDAAVTTAAGAARWPGLDLDGSLPADSDRVGSGRNGPTGSSGASGSKAAGAGGGRSTGEGDVAGRSHPSGTPFTVLLPQLPRLPAGWDVPDQDLLRDLVTGDGAGPTDPFLTGPLGAGRWPLGRPAAAAGAWDADIWAGGAGSAAARAGTASASGGADPPVHGGDLGGGGPVIFDPDLLGALAGRLRDAATDAAGLAVAVARTDETALAAIVSALTAAAAAAGAPGGGLAGILGAGAGARPAAAFRVAGLPMATDVLRMGGHAVAAGGPGLAVAVDRRTAHYLAAEEAVRAGGVLIDQRAWFDDAPPPSLGRIRAAAAECLALIGTDAGALSTGDVREVGRRLAVLPPATREAVVSRLRGEPLRVLLRAFDRLRRSVGVGSDQELAALAAVPDLLLASAPTAMLAELVDLLPDFEPGLPAAGGSAAMPGTDEANRADSVVRDGVSTSDVGQGGLGDCYLAAVLVGLARQRPDLLVDGIRENPNGTFTVTFYRDGRPFPVTVTRALPGLPDGDATGVGDAGGGVAGGARPVPTMAAFDLEGRPELWAAVYEKAYARLHGGYDALGGGDPGVAASDLIGHQHHAVSPGAIGVADVASRLAAGDVITVSTRPTLVDGPPTGLVSRHAYAVLAADVEGGRLLLRNPWMSSDGELVRWFRWDELRPHLRVVTLTPTS